MEVNNAEGVLRQLQELVMHKRSDWQPAMVQRGWNASDQIDMNIAMFLLANCGQVEARDLIDIADILLEKSNDYSHSVVTVL